MAASDTEAELRKSLEALASRVRRLEQLQEVDAAHEQPPPVAKSAPRITSPNQPPLASSHKPATSRAKAPPRPSQPRDAQKAKALDALSLERLVGGQAFAAVGAIVIVVGLGLFLKLAYDQGWLSRTPPALRCWSVAAFGLAMLGAGEIARRRISAAASAGLSAVGVGALYAAIYAGYGVFHLIEAPAAFILFTASVGVGVAIAARARLPFVAYLSLIGGYLTPLLFLDVQPAPGVLPVFLLTLLATGLILSSWLRGAFAGLQSVVWWGTIVYGLVWTVAQGEDHPYMALEFLAATWAAVHASLIVATRGEPGPVSSGAFDKGLPWSSARRFVASFSSTAWATALAAAVLAPWPGDLQWLAPAAGAGVTAAMAMALAGHLRLLRDSPATARESLGASLALQAGALVVVAIALALVDWMEAATWLALGVASIAAGRWLKARALNVYGLIVLSLATLRLVGLQWWLTTSGAQYDLLGLYFTRWSLLVILGAAAWLAAGSLLLRKDNTQRGAAISATGAGLALLLMSLLHDEASASSICLAWLAVSMLTALADRVQPRLALGRLALLGIASATMAWIAAYPAQGWMDAEAPLTLHPGLLTALAIVAGAWVTLRWFTSRRGEDPAFSHAVDAAAGAFTAVLLLAATSLEVARIARSFAHDATASKAAVSIWWCVFGVVLIGAGVSRRAAPWRRAGLALIAAAAVKVMLFDLVEIAPQWRVASFIGLGLMMLAVAMGYMRLSTMLAGDESPTADQSGS